MMKRLLTILCIPALLLLSSTKGWSLPPCKGSNFINWTNCVGTYAYPGWHKYSGEWKDGSEHGQGTSISPSGFKYVGGFKDGKKHGQGTATFPDGTKYVGGWKDGLMHGRGTVYHLDGSVERGTWRNGDFLE